MLSVALGAAVGALNRQPVIAQGSPRSTAAGVLLAALLLSALWGGLVLAIGVVPLRRRRGNGQSADRHAPRAAKTRESEHGIRQRVVLFFLLLPLGALTAGW